MKIRFCHNCTNELIAEFEVERQLSQEESNAIDEYIARKMDEWESHEGDFAEFDFWQCCHDAVEKRVKIIPLTSADQTFYI